MSATDTEWSARRTELRGYDGYRAGFLVVTPTGPTLSVVWDGELQGMDTEAGRWQTVCERHGHILSHRSLADAKAWARDPADWCEACGDPAEHERIVEMER